MKTKINNKNQKPENMFKLFITYIFIGLGFITNGVSTGSFIFFANHFKRFNVAFLELSNLKNVKRNVIYLGTAFVAFKILFILKIYFLEQWMADNAIIWFNIIAGIIIGYLPFFGKRWGVSSKKDDFRFWFVLLGLAIFLLTTVGISNYTVQMPVTQVGSSAFINGLFAGFLMLIPGLSGTLWLKQTNAYSGIMSAFENLYIPFMYVFIIGAIIGIILSIKFIAHAFKTFKSRFLLIIFGTIMASGIYSIVWPVWTSISEIIIFAVSLVSGLVASVIIQKIAYRPTK